MTIAAVVALLLVAAGTAIAFYQTPLERQLRRLARNLREVNHTIGCRLIPSVQQASLHASLLAEALADRERDTQ